MPWLVLLLTITHAVAQPTDSAKHITHFNGAISVTNNGISFIPTFSLGKPAVIFSLSMRKQKISFDPEFRFSLQGKPWSFLFWWRYNLLNTAKFGIRVGAHPALNFKPTLVSVNGVSKEVMITRRYLAGEFVPNYFVSRSISVGLYYLYSRGLDMDAVRYTHFLTINSNFSHIVLFNDYFMMFNPSFYYLRMEKQDGFFISSTITLAKQNFPLSLSSILNKKIESNITGVRNFVGNVTLIYSFSKNYVQKQHS